MDLCWEEAVRRGDAHGVAVGRGLGAGLHADEGAAAGAVLDDHRLADGLRHRRRDGPHRSVQQAARGVIANNQMQGNAEVAIAVKKLAAGVVLGNVGNRPIQLQASATVQHAYNVPPAIT